jgi:KaiC/GvpD/RAD55 family RecA-like ATPase
MWDAWSAGSAEKYPGSGQLQNKWQSFTAGGGVTIGSLFDLAKAKGFTFKPDAIADFSDKKLPEEKKAKVPPAPAAARELVTYAASRVKVKKIDWVWQDYLARGTFHMIVGVQGDGKSVFCYGMIAALTGGRPFINGDKPAQTGRVLLIQGEEDPATIIVPRLQAAGADLQRVSIVSHAREREANEDVQRAFSLQDDVASTRILLEQAELMDDPIIAIVVDPITAYMAGKKKIDAFRDDEMRSMLMPWVRLINKYDVALIVVAHLNKTSGQRAVHRVAQSAAATAAARAVYLVGPANGVADFSEDPNLKIFVPAKYNLGKNPTAQLFTVDGYQHPITQQSVGFAVSKGIANVSADDVLSARKSIERVTPLRDRIWDCVNASGGDGMMRKQIADVLGAQMESAGFQSAIKIMLDQQLLIENKRKLFTPAQFSNRAGAELLI